MNETVAFAKLFVKAKVAPEKVREGLVRLRRSADLTNSVTTVVTEFPKIKDKINGSLADFKRFFRQPQIENIIALATELDHPEAAFLRVAYGSDVYSKANLNPAPLVTGADLIALGLKPGPAFKKILFDAETEQLEGNLVSKEAALDFVKGVL